MKELTKESMSDVHVFVQVDLYKFLVEVSSPCIRGISLCCMADFS